MVSISERLGRERKLLKSQLRADDTRVDVGLTFTAWYNTAQQRLISACTDDDPVCMRVYATEAKVAGLMATEHATNERQRQVGEDIVTTAEYIRTVAETAPPVSPPHTHEH